MADVFISYASADRERVRPFAEALLKRGVSVWWDRALAAGDDYAAVIERELAAAKAVIVLWTANSAASTFVRDEAGRARDQGRLVPVLLEKVQIPLGFGSFQAEDFTAWNGDPFAPQMALLGEVLQARIEGRSVDATKVEARRRRVGARVRLVSIGAVVVTLLVSAASVAILTGRVPFAANGKAPEATAPPAALTREERLAQLLRLVEQGKITGDQALQLAKLVQIEAFDEAAAEGADISEEASQAAPVVPGADAGAQTTAEAPRGATVPAPPLQGAAPPAPVTAQAPETQAEARAVAEAASVTRPEMITLARANFEQSAAALLQNPDARVRHAMTQISQRATRTQGLDQLWAIAAEGGDSAAAIYQACGALMLISNDKRATTALERARTLAPNDDAVWRMLSYSYAREGRAVDAAGASLVGQGLGAAATRDWRGASANLSRALDVVEDPNARGVVFGRLGDAAAASADWKSAEARYRSAMTLHRRTGNLAALAADASKLAQAQLRRGDRAAACATLRRAQEAGAVLPPEEVTNACGEAAAGEKANQTPEASETRTPLPVAPRTPITLPTTPRPASPAESASQAVAPQNAAPQSSAAQTAPSQGAAAQAVPTEAAAPSAGSAPPSAAQTNAAQNNAASANVAHGGAATPAPTQQTAPRPSTTTAQRTQTVPTTRPIQRPVAPPPQVTRPPQRPAPK